MFGVCLGLSMFGVWCLFGVRIWCLVFVGVWCLECVFGLFGVGVWCLLQSVRQHGMPMRDMRTVMMNDADDDDDDYVVPKVL